MAARDSIDAAAGRTPRRTRAASDRRRVAPVAARDSVAAATARTPRRRRGSSDRRRVAPVPDRAAAGQARTSVAGRMVSVRAARPGDPPILPGAWRTRLWRELDAAAPDAVLELYVAPADLPAARAWLAFRSAWPSLLAGRTRARDARLAGALALSERDESLARLIAAAGAPDIPQHPSTFATLARAIAYQQLSGKAAATIWGRVKDLVGGQEPSAEQILARRAPVLRKAGLSAAKVAAVFDLARHVRRGDVVPEALRGMGDDEVVARLTRVRGIGRWSAHMHLIFSLGRLDVWPTGDLGVRKGFTRWRGLANEPSERSLEPLGDLYRPYRTLAAWYAWRAIDVQFP